MTNDHLSSPFSINQRQTRLQTHNYSSISYQRKKNDDSYLVKSTIGGRMGEKDFKSRIEALQNENMFLRQQL
jgi:hypothetical protein